MCIEHDESEKQLESRSTREYDVLVELGKKTCSTRPTSTDERHVGAAELRRLLVPTYARMINGHGRNLSRGEAREVFKRLRLEVEPSLEWLKNQGNRGNVVCYKEKGNEWTLSFGVMPGLEREEIYWARFIKDTRPCQKTK